MTESLSRSSLVEAVVSGLKPVRKARGVIGLEVKSGSLYSSINASISFRRELSGSNLFEALCRHLAINWSGIFSQISF